MLNYTIQASWAVFLAIPIISFLLPSTGTALVQVGFLLAGQSVLLFLIADQLMGAIIWMIYVGAISVLFLVAVTSLTPMQWKKQSTSRNHDSAISITAVCALIGGYYCFIETVWLVTRSTPASLQYGNVAGLGMGGYKLTAVDPLLQQAMGFTEESTMYIVCGLLLLMGMFIVIQTIVTPATIAKYVETNANKARKS